MAIEQPEAREERCSVRMNNLCRTRGLDREGRASTISPRRAATSVLNNRTDLFVARHIAKRVCGVLATNFGEAMKGPEARKQVRSDPIGNPYHNRVEDQKGRASTRLAHTVCRVQGRGDIQVWTLTKQDFMTRSTPLIALVALAIFANSQWLSSLMQNS
ncbi:hypothetical protein [Bradyrhizobium sp. USDA 10063]